MDARNDVEVGIWLPGFVKDVARAEDSATERTVKPVRPLRLLGNISSILEGLSVSLYVWCLNVIHTLLFTELPCAQQPFLSLFFPLISFILPLLYPLKLIFSVLAIELAFDLHVLFPSLNLYLPALVYITAVFTSSALPHDLGCELFERKSVFVLTTGSVVNEACVNSLVTTAVSFFPDLE